MSYLSALDAGVLETGGGGTGGSQNLQEVLSLGASASGISITSCPSISNLSGAVALSGETLTLTSQQIVNIVAPLGLAINGDVGTAGFVLTSGGADAPASWEASGTTSQVLTSGGTGEPVVWTTSGGSGGSQNLAQVLLAGSSAGATDINMNQNDIVNVGGLYIQNSINPSSLSLTPSSVSIDSEYSSWWNRVTKSNLTLFQKIPRGMIFEIFLPGSINECTCTLPTIVNATTGLQEVANGTSFIFGGTVAKSGTTFNIVAPDNTTIAYSVNTSEFYIAYQGFMGAGSVYATVYLQNFDDGTYQWLITVIHGNTYHT